MAKSAVLKLQLRHKLQQKGQPYEQSQTFPGAKTPNP